MLRDHTAKKERRRPVVTKPAKTAEILQRECKTGYCDSAVFGGFSTWLYQYAAALSQDLKGQLQALAQELSLIHI